MVLGKLDNHMQKTKLVSYLTCEMNSIWIKGLIVRHECMPAKLLHSCLTLSNPMDCSLTGSSAHGILQARILE